MSEETARMKKVMFLDVLNSFYQQGFIDVKLEPDGTWFKLKGRGW